MELTHVKENVFYIKGSVNVGVIKVGRNAILIDTGLDSTYAKKINKLLQANNLKVHSIINTHSHADHCGGNAYFMALNEEVKIYAPKIESSIIENPIIEAFSFYSGAFPIKELQSKHMVCEPSSVNYIIDKKHSLQIEGIEISALPLKGHSLNHYGFVYDDILFCGDAVFSESVILKHGIPFCVNVEEQINTLNFLSESNFKYYVQSHGTTGDDLKIMVCSYIDVINKVSNCLLKLLCEELSFEEIMEKLNSIFSIVINSIPQHYLMQTVILSYLSYLNGENKVKCRIVDNKLMWQKII